MDVTDQEFYHARIQRLPVLIGRQIVLRRKKHDQDEGIQIPIGMVVGNYCLLAWFLVRCLSKVLHPIEISWIEGDQSLNLYNWRENPLGCTSTWDSCDSTWESCDSTWESCDLEWESCKEEVMMTWCSRWEIAVTISVNKYVYILTAWFKLGKNTLCVTHRNDNSFL